MARKPYAFFYGGYMDPEVLELAGASPENCEAGYVDGFELTVGPLANLEAKKNARAYGLLAQLSHDDLEKLYGGNPAALKGAPYLPEAVLVYNDEGRSVPAMTYICPALSGEKPDQAYVAKLVRAAEKLQLPADYLAMIQSFAGGLR